MPSMSRPQYYRYQSPYGAIIFTCQNGYLTQLFWETEATTSTPSTHISEQSIGKLTGQAVAEVSEQIAPQVFHWLEQYFSGAIPSAPPPMQLKGTVFQQEVWELLSKIPYGQTCSYGDLAREIAKRRGIKTMSAQAVGTAISRNPIGVIVPCHRVINSDGKVGNYNGGSRRKAQLLGLEKSVRAALMPTQAERFKTPQKF